MRAKVTYKQDQQQREILLGLLHGMCSNKFYLQEGELLKKNSKKTFTQNITRAEIVKKQFEKVKTNIDLGRVVVLI